MIYQVTIKNVSSPVELADIFASASVSAAKFDMALHMGYSTVQEFIEDGFVFVSVEEL